METGYCGILNGQEIQYLHTCIFFEVWGCCSPLSIPTSPPRANCRERHLRNSPRKQAAVYSVNTNGKFESFGVEKKDRRSRAQQTTSFNNPQEKRHKGLTVCSKAIMISYTIIVSFVLLGMVSAQTGLTLEACVTKENNLEMLCKINSSSINTCTYLSEGKVVVSTDGVPPQDSTYKNRANIYKMDKVCKMTLTGLMDKAQIFNCTINGAKSVSKSVEKKTLDTCSACSIIQHAGVTLLCALLASHLMPQLL
ncbi:hypothetical protein AOLI_G00265510 [Acnodon oligacanthus]